MKVHGDFTTPPVDIVEDQDVEFFMTVRMDFAGLTLCVVYGSQEVGHYRTIWRDEFGLTEDGTEVIPPKPKLWRESYEPTDDRLDGSSKAEGVEDRIGNGGDGG
ncbi:SWIM-type domain-containing protein [Raphanus sativus]|nr:SWIM-type domain-containing protein [Raphanus sativus]